jgi:hypothetical protein
MTKIKNNVRTRRGLRRALAVIETNLQAVGPGLSKADREDYEQGVAWLRQESAEPVKKAAQ